MGTSFEWRAMTNFRDETFTALMNRKKFRNWQTLLSLALLVVGDVVLTVPSAFAQNVTKDAMLNGIARNVIVPDHQDLAVKCRALTASIEQLVKAPTTESVQKTREAWLAALLASDRVRWLQTGPMADHEYLSTFYYSKVLPPRIDEVLQSSRVIDDSYIEELGATAKGIFTLENLLFEPRSNSPTQGLTNATPDLNKLFSTNVQRRGLYLLALARDVQKKADRVAQDWGSTNRQDAAAKFTAGGQATLNSLVNQMAKILETLAENHLNFALRLPSPVMNQLDRIEGARSRTSLPQLLEVLRGIHKAYRGGNGEGIDDYLRGLNAPLAGRVEERFQKAVTAVEAIDVPLEVAVTDRKELVQRAYQAIHDLEIIFKVDMASALGVTITFTSGDGD